MATNILGTLIAAAKLAQDLSAHRSKQITIKVQGDGLLIEGELFELDGRAKIGESRGRVTWGQLDDGTDAVVTIIREVDRRLTPGAGSTEQPAAG